MKLSERLCRIDKLFNDLENTTGRNEKEWLLKKAKQEDAQLAADITYALEILDGQHKLGYTFFQTRQRIATALYDEKWSLQEYLKPLFRPKEFGKFDIQTIVRACSWITHEVNFVKMLVNREWRLGIGKSQLAKSALSPMLAKKFDWDKIPKSTKDYFVTEKLDGNRCIAQYNFEENRWEFWSRSGKQLRVNFDMGSLPTAHTYDGEILSKRQLSNERGQAAFNELSGIVNSKEGDKDQLVYMIFDITSAQEDNYWHRRRMLNFFGAALKSNNVQILPELAVYSSVEDLKENLEELLQQVVSTGGEGLMVNIGDRLYEHKRTDALLKVKNVYTMDMRVVELCEGTGKNAGKVGALCCEVRDDNRIYSCKVGSGLSDEQRQFWADCPNAIIGEIVEVAYFSISQDANARGTNIYALRFPRLKRVRKDKQETSAH